MKANDWKDSRILESAIVTRQVSVSDFFSKGVSLNRFL